MPTSQWREVQKSYSAYLVVGHRTLLIYSPTFTGEYQYDWLNCFTLAKCRLVPQMSESALNYLSNQLVQFIFGSAKTDSRIKTVA